MSEVRTRLGNLWHESNSDSHWEGGYDKLLRMINSFSIFPDFINIQRHWLSLLAKE